MVFNLQALKFHMEIAKLHEAKTISSAKIQGLNPFIDAIDGIDIVRVGGRLSRDNIPFNTNHPMLLQNNHIVVNALFEYPHRTNMHAGAHALCAFVRQRFWVISTRQLARKTVRSCTACFRHRPVVDQIMGSLPASRVQQGLHPFEGAVLDYAGPLSMHLNQRGRRPVKVYLCVFVCFLTTACHLELASELNATDFVGASRGLKEMEDSPWNASNKHHIGDRCSHLGVGERCENSEAIAGAKLHWNRVKL